MKTSKSYPNIAQSLGITGVIIIIMILVGLVTPLLNQIVSSEATALIFQVLAMGIPLLIIRYVQKRKAVKNSFNLTIKHKKIIPFIMIAGVVLLLGIVGPLTELIPMPASMRLAYAKAASETGFLTFVLMVIAAPILEEMIFRGIILDGLLKKYSPLVSILFSSFLFGIVHLNPWQLVTGLIMGIFIGWVYYKSKSLLAAILIHSSANFSAYFLRFFIDSSTMDKSYAETVGGTTNFILVITGTILIISISIYFLNKEFIKPIQVE